MFIKNRSNRRQFGRFLILCLFTIAISMAVPAMAKDTDVYQVSTKNNSYVLMDSSGSMNYALYDSTKDYGAIYDYFYEMGKVTDVVEGSLLYQDHEERTKIYLVRGDVNVSTATIDGETVAFTGDSGSASNYRITWQLDSVVDTHTLIDAYGNLSGDGVGTQRITTDLAGNILFDDNTLPLGQDIALHEMVTLYDNTAIDQGFGGLLHAPGAYFSGFNRISPSPARPAEDGDEDIYFFATGNWLNLQTIFNLEFTSGPHNGDPAWQHESYPLSGSPTEWSTLTKTVAYPAGPGNYPNRLNAGDALVDIVQADAVKMQLHFSEFDIRDGNWNRDRVNLYDASGTLIVTYDHDNPPPGGMSEIIDGDTVRLELRSNNWGNAGGYTVDYIRYVREYDEPTDTEYYTIKSRLDAAKDALYKILEKFHGKMNWGLATFDSSGNAHGATMRTLLDPDNSDTAQREAIEDQLAAITATGGTPLGEALQDVFQKGFYDIQSRFGSTACRKNYIISMTDGYPSGDTQWNRISGVTMTDSDGDGWTSDPNQSHQFGPNYYDDVAEWIYKHSWQDRSEVDDPATVIDEAQSSYFNATTHHIAFGSQSPILKDAAGQSGGIYTAVFDEAQLVAAFYALALQMTDAVAFTAPVVSVDAANKIQNGDDLYLGLFLPQSSGGWVGNLKKYRLGDGSTARPDLWMLYDSSNNPAISSSGQFLDNRDGFWGDESDTNDSDTYGGHDVQEDGVGEILTERVAANLAGPDYYERPIYTYLLDTLTKVEPTNINITNGTLDVTDDQARFEVINYLHGYTNEAADADDSTPQEAREWALGSIVHSSPVVVDYFDSYDITSLLKRYVVVGANDGMLHVFDDADGREIFAFVPPEVLPKLKILPEQPLVDTVDGDITLYRRDKNPQYLIFGLRRGGSAYWCLNVSDPDPLNWSVQWSYNPNEMGQTWAKPELASIPVGVDATSGTISFKDIVIFTGGYDAEEDHFPEPFLDRDDSGSPFDVNGDIDSSEWQATDGDQDVQDNDVYDRFNPGMNEVGRGIFAVDIDDPTAVSQIGGNTVIPFSVTYGATNNTTGNAQTLTSMTYCFPASPSVVTTSLSYIYTEDDELKEGRRGSVLDAVYATDVYANIYKLVYDFKVEKSGSTYAVVQNGWTVNHVFSGNFGSDSSSGNFGQGVDIIDRGRKAFYGPAVSWGGACDYFDAGNYGIAGTVFSGLHDIATLYFGTGDREHPTYTMSRNRVYAVYDDSSVTANNGSAVTVSGIGTGPYTENNLLNLSCDELDDSTTLNANATFTKDDLRVALRDDAVRLVSGSLALENGTEDDAKGWYVILEDQGDTTACDHCDYAATVEGTSTASRDNHSNEKILSNIGLYAGVLYFTSYQPSRLDQCNPQGNGFAYSLNYCDATAAYNLNQGNDLGVDARKDVTDRYRKFNAIYGIPSGFALVTRKGQAGGMAMMAGSIIGPTGNTFRINSPGMGLELYYWREGNSQEMPPAGETSGTTDP